MSFLGSPEDCTITSYLCCYFSYRGSVTLPLSLVKNWNYIQITFSGSSASGGTVGASSNIGTNKVATSGITVNPTAAIDTNGSGGLTCTIKLTNA